MQFHKTDRSNPLHAGAIRRERSDFFHEFSFSIDREQGSVADPSSGLFFFANYGKTGYIKKMMDMKVFTKVEGSKTDKDLVFLGLSTCGFCKRARKFLEEHGFSYSYVDIDKLDRDVRVEIKDEVRKNYTDDLLYPILLIDNSEYVKGFKKDQWAEKLD